MNVPLVAPKSVFPGEAIVPTILTPGYGAGELLGLCAVSDGAMADQIRPSLGGELAMLFDTVEERIARLVIVISLVGDVFSMDVCGEVAAFETTA